MTVPHMKDARGSLSEIEGSARRVPSLPVDTMGPGGARVVGNIVSGAPAGGHSVAAAKIGPGDMIADRTTETGKAEDSGSAQTAYGIKTVAAAYGDMVAGGDPRDPSPPSPKNPSNDRGVAGKA